eukprot:UN10424
MQHIHRNSTLITADNLVDFHKDLWKYNSQSKIVKRLVNETLQNNNNNNNNGQGNNNNNNNNNNNGLKDISWFYTRRRIKWL